MKRLLLVIVYLSTPPIAIADAANEAFENLADEYIGDLSNVSPVYATLLGDHTADGRLDQVDKAGRDESRAMLDDYRTALQAIDRERLSAHVVVLIGVGVGRSRADAIGRDDSWRSPTA